jgi:hypothetical protein
MRLARVVWLIALTLVATTLPPSAWAAALPKPEPKPAPKARQQRPSSRPAGTKPDEKPGGIKIAPNTELWDGSSTRSASVPGPVLINGVPGDASHGVPPLAPAVITDVQSAPNPAPIRQTGWVIGHYPHAPPLT